MDFSSKSYKEVLEIAEPIWENIVQGSNNNDYEKLSKDFSRKMLKDVTQEEVEHQMAESIQATGNIKNEKEFISCIYRDSGVTILWKGYFEKQNGEVLAQLTLDEEDGEIKVFGSFIG